MDDKGLLRNRNFDTEMPWKPLEYLKIHEMNQIFGLKKKNKFKLISK